MTYALPLANNIITIDFTEIQIFTVSSNAMRSFVRHSNTV